MSDRRGERRGTLTWSATVVALVVLVVGCEDPPWAVDDGAVRLSTPPCDDQGDCVMTYEFDGRGYEIAATSLTDDDIAAREVERLEVAEPAGIDALVTTDDPAVIYLHTDEGWREGRSHD